MGGERRGPYIFLNLLLVLMYLRQHLMSYLSINEN